jgi:glycosyltransferase involved in cell wall biosynthesis
MGGIIVSLHLLLRYYGSTCHLIDGTGLYIYDISIKEIYDKIQLLINDRDLLKKFKENALRLSKTLSYDNIALESILYQQNMEPLEFHTEFMSIKYCDQDYHGFHRIR